MFNFSVYLMNRNIEAIRNKWGKEDSSTYVAAAKIHLAHILKET